MGAHVPTSEAVIVPRRDGGNLGEGKLLARAGLGSGWGRGT
jgi:hypothetical protein